MSSQGRRFSADVFAESKRRRSRTLTELRRDSLSEKEELKRPKEAITNALLLREKNVTGTSEGSAEVQQSVAVREY